MAEAPLPPRLRPMNAFVSTRGAGPATFSEALLQGLAPDGGLYVPVGLPEWGRERPPAGAGFQETARWAARHMLARAAEPLGKDLGLLVHPEGRRRGGT